MKQKIPKSKSPVDLSDNFKLVKTRRNNRTKMRIMSCILVFFLVTVLISTFFIPKSKTSIEYEEQFPNGENENIAPQYGQISDVNQIVATKKKNNLLNNSKITTTPQQQQTTDINVNVSQPIVRVEKSEHNYNYKKDEKKLGEFFATSKTTTPSEKDEEFPQQKSHAIQSFKPKNPPQKSTEPYSQNNTTETTETTQSIDTTEESSPEFIL